MITVKFWATINGNIGDDDAKNLWFRIRHGKEVNLMVMETEFYIYGTTTIYVLTDILCHCSRLGYPIQLNIE